ncbi:Importin beta-like protein kap111 [Paramyrothecium foliicola]|nr:Importin beta-like protein kap111 [Paramyrothecium foliicola]
MQNETQVSSLGEVEHLILSLYQPNPPEVIANIQGTLSRLQGSQQAWDLARQLLTRPDEKVKFFGVLTIIVKLNTESASLNDETATELLICLIDWYLDSLVSGGGQLVSRKLASALATFFLHFHRLWPQHLHHLLFCIAAGRACPPNAIDASLNVAALFKSLHGQQLQALLWVATSITEEVMKVDLNAANNMGLFGILLEHTEVSVLLVTSGLSSESTSTVAQQDAIKYLQVSLPSYIYHDDFSALIFWKAWIWLAQKAGARDSRIVEPLRPLLSSLIETLTDAQLYNTSVELVTDVLSHYSTLLTPEHVDRLGELLESDWSQGRYQDLMQGDTSFESTQFGQLLLAFGDAQVQILMKGSNKRSHAIVTMLCNLLGAEGYPVADNTIFVPAVEFWSTFAETLTDEMYSGDEPSNSWANNALSYVLQAVSHAWQKITYPPMEEFSQWDSIDRAGFNDARKDVIDLLQSTYTLAGADLVLTFAELILTNLTSSSWLRLEAAAFCLCGLADCNLDESRCDAALSSVFTSPLFSVLQTGNLNVSHRVRQTCVSLIEHYTDYFERHVDLLPAALGLLFNMVGEHAMAVPTSKSILRLCSSCRHHLHSEAGAFLEEYGRLVDGKRLDCFSSERVLGAISAVIQAIPDDSTRFSACGKILAYIQDDARLSVQLAGAPDSAALPCSSRPQCFGEAADKDGGLHVALRSLRCLASVAKGLQSPSDVSIDLERDPRTETDAQPREELVQLQRIIIGIIVQIQGAYGSNPEVTELICHVLRGGLSESQPGPFVLPAKDVALYLIKHDVNIPRIGVMVTTACSLFSSLHSREDQDKVTILNDLLLWVIGLAKQLSSTLPTENIRRFGANLFQGPHSDPELSQNCIEFVSHVTSKNHACLLQLQPPDAAEYFFFFTLEVIDGKEPLPKAAAAEFWSIFVGLRTEDIGQQASTQQALETLGPLLCQSLARNIGGNASRSELDKLAEPLKKLVSRHSAARDWLEASLSHPSFPSNKVTSEQKTMFVKKIISLRGSRATNQVVRDFWLSARGSNFAYAS